MKAYRLPWKGHPRLPSRLEKAHPCKRRSQFSLGTVSPAAPLPAVCHGSKPRRAGWAPSNRARAPPACSPRAAAGCGEPSCPHVCLGGSVYAYLLYQSMNSWQEAARYCGSQGKVGNILTEANLHQNQHTVRGFRAFGGRNEISKLSVRTCFSTDMSKNSKNLQRAVVLK